MPTIQVNSEGILHLLLDLKPNKAPGPDKTPACLLNELACELADWLYYIRLFWNKVAYLLNGRILM